MQTNAISKVVRLGAAVSVAGLLAVGCSSSDAAEEGATTSAPAATTTVQTDDNDGLAPADDAAVRALPELLPANASDAFLVDFDGLASGGSSAAVTVLLSGEGTDPMFSEPLGAIEFLGGGLALSDVATSALLAHTTDATAGPFLLAALRSESVDDVTTGSEPLANGNQLTILPGGVLVVGQQSVVESVIDVSNGEGTGSSTIPFTDVLSDESHISFAYGMPALFDSSISPDGTLRTASLVGGAFDIIDGAIEGSMSFHTADATDFVSAYNSLNRHTALQEDAPEEPLAVTGSLVAGLDHIVVDMPPTPLDASDDELVASRNLFKKLFIGMEATHYAKSVADRTDGAWLDFLVKSEQDEQTPPSPGSVYIRWEFKDQAAIDAFEANELPAGFRLAPTRFLESDAPEGEYFLALNLYNAGSSLVSGARAEWDVFVHGPDGADPNAGERPRFMVVEALAEEVSADAGNLLTPAEPLSHELVGDLVVSNVQRFEGESQVPVFESTFPAPDPEQAEVARFTREMAIGNDYIYWSHGVSDRVLYNATTFNHDAYFVDTTQLTYTDDSPWAQYLKPVVKDAVYYNNTLEYVASPMANLDSDYLDITPEWLDVLVGFTTNGHQEGLMRKAVEQLFRGQDDALVGLHIGNETPSTYVNFEITDPEGLTTALDLPEGHSLAPISLTEGEPEQHYLTLSVFEVDDAMEGTRAEWSVYVDDGSGRPHLLILDLMTASAGFDSATILNLPSEVEHALADGVMSIRLASTTVNFEASFETEGVAEKELTMDWIEAGDIVCSAINICNKYYYDAETLDVPVHQAATVTVDAFTTPWSDFVTDTPSVVFYRDNAQEYVVAPWYNLKVPVDLLPFSGLEGATHTISGTGELIGRSNEVANSIYTYSGDAVLDGEQLTFAIDQEINNALGLGNIYTTGDFDLTSGSGTVTVVDCVGNALLCSDIEPGFSTFYATEALEASDVDAISWQVNVIVDLGSSFGIADSASSFEATRLN
ncbi:MAG: hypothetical protein KJO18_03855 [Acidimicrobiia bacterium]|nr:hypothetical protein [Acidimicrobiia bacterium]